MAQIITIAYNNYTKKTISKNSVHASHDVAQKVDVINTTNGLYFGSRSD